jgi:hypothetical protein
LGWAFLSVIALAARLISQMQDRERNWRVTRDPAHVRFGVVGWFRITGLGIAVGIVGVTLAGELVGSSSLDEKAVRLPYSAGALLVAALCAVAAMALARSIAHAPLSDTRIVSLRVAAAGLIVVAAIAWVATLHVLAHGYHALGWGLAFGLVAGAGYYHSLVYHSGREHEARIGRSARIVALICALAAGSAMWWLVSAGVWSDRGPIVARQTANVVLICLVGTGLAMWLAGGALCRSRSGGHNATYPPPQNLSNDMLGYVAMPLVAAVLPAIAASRLRYADPSDITVIVLLFTAITGVGIAVRSIRLTNRTIERFLTDERRYLERSESPEAVERRMRLVAPHFRFLQALGIASLLLGAAWVLVSAANARP